MSVCAWGFRNVSRSVDGSMGGSPFNGRGPARRARLDKTDSPSAGRSRSRRCASAMIDWFL